MNEKLQNALSELVASGLDAKNFLIQETPEVISQLLDWYFVWHMIWFVFGFLMAVYTVGYVCFIIKFHDEINGERAENTAIFCGFIAMGCTVGAPLVMYNNLEWLQIIIAPKIYLIEYVANIAK